jgi:hypothetical protein
MIRTLFLLLLPALASAQVLDTTYFTTVNGQLFQTSRVVYEDGTYTESRILTDTARVVTITARKIEGQAQTFSEYAKSYAPYREVFRKAIAQDASIRSQLGQSPLGNLQEVHSIPFTDTLSTWAYQKDGVQTPVTFTVTSTGVFRVKIGNETLRTVVILGDILRIANLDGGWQYLVKLRDGRWSDVTGTYQLVRTQLRKPDVE